jgi:hypothetical protein
MKANYFNNAQTGPGALALSDCVLMFPASPFFPLRPRRKIMKRRLSVLMVTLLGILGSGRLADAQPGHHSHSGPLSSEKEKPSIDSALPARLATATFALG